MNPIALGAIKILLLAHATQGTITGSVWDAESVAPIAGAVVTVADLNRSVAADDSGRYVLHGIPSGDHQIRIHFIGYSLRSFEALVPERGILEIDVWLQPEPVPIHPVDIRGPVAVRGLGAGGYAFPDREISAAALANHPMLAEPDPLLALGGGEISLRPESASGVNIRGGASDQTGYVLDEIPILSPYHTAGMSGAWNPDAVSRMRLASATPLDAAPSALAGTIEAVTLTPGDRVRAQGGVSTTQSRVTIDGPLRLSGLGGGDAADPTTTIGYLLSYRSGLPNVVAPRHEPSYIQGESGDWLAKVVAPALGGRVELLGYGNENDFNAEAQVPADSAGAWNRTGRNLFMWASRSLGARWTRDLSAATLRVVGWRAEGSAGSTWESHEGTLDMAAHRRDRGLMATLERSSTRSRSTLRLRMEESRTSYRILSDSSSVPSWAMGATMLIPTVLARHERSLGSHTRVNLGLSVASALGRARLGPSAQLVWNPSLRWELSGSHVRTLQFAQSLRNPESVAGNLFPADLYLGAGASPAEGMPGPAGAPEIPVAGSDLSVVGASFHPRAALRIGVQGYTRRSDGLLLVAPLEGKPFATGAFLTGSGSSRGASVDLAVSAARYGIVASYALQDVKLRYGTRSYAPESGARHLLEAGVIVFPSATTTIRANVTSVLGRRGTSVRGGFEWESTNLVDRGSEFGGSPYYDPNTLGATSLPSYWRLDLGFRKEWRLGVAGRDASIGLFGTATNLLARKNVLSYSRDPATGAPGGIEMRPRSPLVVGLDWRF